MSRNFSVAVAENFRTLDMFQSLKEDYEIKYSINVNSDILGTISGDEVYLYRFGATE
jgi:hypothetical protein